MALELVWLGGFFMGFDGGVDAVQEMKTMVAAVRPPFLVLVPVCVIFAMALAVASGAALHWFDVLVVTVGALSAHAAVNALNEHHDFISGLDMLTERTPFSGGSGALPSSPERVDQVRNLALLLLVVTVCVGLYLIARGHWALLPIGGFGLLLIVAYTPWVNRYPWACLLAPGLGFGLLMVAGSAIVFGAVFHFSTWLALLVPVLLTSNLLLYNQLPDAEADQQVGRRHFAIVYGKRAAWRLAGGLSLAVYAVVLLCWLLGFSSWVLLSLLTVPLAYVAWKNVGKILQLQEKRGLQAKALAGGQWVPGLAPNVVVTLLTPVLFALGVFLA